METIVHELQPKEPVSPWGKTAKPVSSNFADIMSEQLAMDIHLKQEERFAQKFSVGLELEPDVDPVEKSEPISLPRSEGLGLDPGLDLHALEGCDSDRVIAEMLQVQFDREYDDMLKQSENKYNGSSKVSISFSNYRSVHDNPSLVYDSDSDEEVMEDKHQDWDNFSKSEKEFKSIPRCGYKKQGEGMVTKHDAALSNRRNACRVMSFPPEFQTGDGGGFDMQLSNKVFNSLKAHSRNESSRRNRIHDKSDSATAEMGLDEKTRLILFKFVNQGLLDQVNGILSTGKEAVIIHADGGQSDETIVPRECAIKVFKTTLNEFKTRDKYIADDYRFKDRFSKQNPRKIVHLWAEKEMHNLNRMRRCGIRCPEVVTLKKHVLVMSFVGDDHRPARKLKDAALNADECRRAYDQVIHTMCTMYDRAGLVHADLSEYNILWHDGECWFIDVSQSVERNHPRALEFLRRDCDNVCAFFNRRTRGGVDVGERKSAAELFEMITGPDVQGNRTGETDANRAAMLGRVRDFERNNELLANDCPEKIYPFDYCWEESKQEQS